MIRALSCRLLRNAKDAGRHASLPVENQGRGHGLQRNVLGHGQLDFALGVLHRRVLDAEGPLEGHSSFLLIADVDADEFGLALELSAEFNHVRRFDAARCAGGVPEVQDRHLADPVGGIDLGPVVGCGTDDHGLRTRLRSVFLDRSIAGNVVLVVAFAGLLGQRVFLHTSCQRHHCCGEHGRAQESASSQTRWLGRSGIGHDLRLQECSQRRQEINAGFCIADRDQTFTFKVQASHGGESAFAFPRVVPKGFAFGGAARDPNRQLVADQNGLRAVTAEFNRTITVLNNGGHHSFYLVPVGLPPGRTKGLTPRTSILVPSVVA